MKTKLTEKMIDNRAKKIKALEEQIKMLNEEKENLQKQIKSEMELRCVDMIQTEKYKISWKEIVSRRLDTNRIKTERPELYEEYTKNSVSMRFTIA